MKDPDENWSRKEKSNHKIMYSLNYWKKNHSNQIKQDLKEGNKQNSDKKQDENPYQKGTG